MSTSPTFEDMVQKLRTFLRARGWDKDDPRGLAVSISLEANELLEHYQWSSTPVGTPDELASELADVLIYAIQFADCYDIDIPTAIQRKLEKSNKKYPVKDFQKNTDQEQRLAAWYAAKQRHTKEESL